MAVTMSDAVCVRCGDWGVQWNLEVQDAAGNWQTVCTECERPEDWPDTQE